AHSPGESPRASPRFPGVAGYRVPLLRRFSAGARRVSPVARHDLAPVLSLPPPPKCFAASVPCDNPSCLRPKSEGSAFGVQYSRGHMGSLALRPGDSLAILTRWLCQWASGSSVSLLPAIPATGLRTLAPVGLSPTDHASLRWTHTSHS